MGDKELGINSVKRMIEKRNERKQKQREKLEAKGKRGEWYLKGGSPLGMGASTPYHREPFWATIHRREKLEAGRRCIRSKPLKEEK